MPPALEEEGAETAVLFVAVLFATAVSEVSLVTVAVESCLPAADAVAVTLIVAEYRRREASQDRSARPCRADRTRYARSCNARGGETTPSRLRVASR